MAGIALPQTATGAPSLIQSGVLFLMLAGLLAAIRWIQRLWVSTAWARRRQ
jgi:LPXTG-motif cell wall-anchored protein